MDTDELAFQVALAIVAAALLWKVVDAHRRRLSTGPVSVTQGMLTRLLIVGLTLVVLVTIASFTIRQWIGDQLLYLFAGAVGMILVACLGLGVRAILQRFR